MNTKLLKQKILDLAIRGKLTQQLKSDGTARELLEQISSKVSSSSSTLSSPRRRGSPSSSAAKTIIPLEKSEAPFEIPANWEWVRIGDIFNLQAGKNIAAGLISSTCEDGYYPCFGGNGLRGFVSCFNREGDYPLIGRQGALCGNINRATGKFYATEHAVVVETNSMMNVSLACFFLTQLNLNQYASSTAQPGLSVAKINEVPIPLPPLAEQQRIVAKIEETFAEIDAIEKNKELLKTHIKQTRQKILDLAIHGKLVPQNKSDEPASVLLERITRDNPHYEKIGVDNVPFEIPEKWCWCRLGDVCKPIKRGKSPKYIEHSNVLVFAQKCNQKDGPVSLEKALYLDESTLNKYPKEEFLQKGDVVINSTGTGTLGRVGYFNVDLPQNIKGIVPDSHVTTIRSSVVNSNYLYSYLKNKQSYLEKNGEGSTNQKELKPHTIYDLEFPLPPLAEQKRIVNKIEEIFASLDEISLHLV